MREIVARCVSVMVYYHNDVETPRADRLMAAEVGALASSLVGLGLARGEAEALILRPVEEELLARYGHELGPRLHRMFVAAFESGASRGRPSWHPSRPEPAPA